MNKNTEVSIGSGSIGFVGLLQLSFIILKLCNVINWNWWLVMLPTLISGGLIVLVILFMLILCLIALITNN